MTQTVAEREAALLAPYAMHSVDSAGREFPEPTHPYRGPFQRDRDRILHSAAYRRLAHKTQVFTGHLGDYHRTRLTHTLEVASIARTIGRVLGLNEDLIEALALMHDIGHPPFGHAGEDVLDECAQGAGGFNHNSHALRIVTLLERRYPEFPGLNLSREVLAGQSTREKHGAAAQQPRLEVQVVDAADSIAYNAHDADDALELGLLGIDDLLELDLWRNAASLVHQRYHHLEPAARRRAIVHQLIDLFVGDVIEQSQYQLALAAPASSDAVANEREPLVQNSVSYREQKRQFESFLFMSVYRHPAVLAERAVAGTALREMFEHFCAHPDALPADSSHRMAEDGIVRVVCDFLASLTDRAALELFSGQ